MLVSFEEAVSSKRTDTKDAFEATFPGKSYRKKTCCARKIYNRSEIREKILLFKLLALNLPPVIAPPCCLPEISTFRTYTQYMTRETAAKIKEMEYFSTEEVSGGGKTGSAKRTSKSDPAEEHQLKRPIRCADCFRKTKASDHDHENFGEFIAALIAKAFSPKPRTVPEVDLVAFGNGQGVGIASRYLSNPDLPGEKKLESQTVDDFLKSLNPTYLNKKSKHIEITAENAQQFRHTQPFLVPGLCRGLALSMLVGDHDVNP
ncbi:MAG: hypothetical protein NTU49_04875, partial [Gammaproteobacteria bacterium]|nr:hypothetical protein [Gammaproteobacteria bacterium]